MSALYLFQLGFGVQQPAGIVVSDDLMAMVVKILFVAAAAIYAVFALVMVRQIHVMRHTLFTSLSGVVRILGYVQLVLAGAVLIGFITLL
ncbi:MAG: hypothetical protein COU69_03410 [Candidatus Pacebacteria bacterium CG10_big_fil_rev_8_21_14_0_10_56_10]|nr:MAG: hypothetical protein COU69_03410 [Candidatus Pacebacteria bacterium CG10_big_fil_rev_8_21_14_0_10_56_10]